ncbi:MAG: hypothetical protein M3O22_03670 [Pseudomonadota bacterium]|nr:hypothetical protein [Pseudomonadota bacterium]
MDTGEQKEIRPITETAFQVFGRNLSTLLKEGRPLHNGTWFMIMTWVSSTNGDLAPFVASLEKFSGSTREEGISALGQTVKPDRRGKIFKAAQSVWLLNTSGGRTEVWHGYQKFSPEERYDHGEQIIKSVSDGQTAPSWGLFRIMEKTFRLLFMLSGRTSGLSDWKKLSDEQEDMLMNLGRSHALVLKAVERKSLDFASSFELLYRALPEYPEELFFMLIASRFLVKDTAEILGNVLQELGETRQNTTDFARLWMKRLKTASPYGKDMRWSLVSPEGEETDMTFPAEEWFRINDDGLWEISSGKFVILRDSADGKYIPTRDLWEAFSDAVIMLLRVVRWYRKALDWASRDPLDDFPGIRAVLEHADRAHTAEWEALQSRLRDKQQLAELAVLEKLHTFLKQRPGLSRQPLTSASSPTPAAAKDAAPEETTPTPITGATLKPVGFSGLDPEKATARITALTAVLRSILGLGHVDWADREALRRELEVQRAAWQERKQEPWPDLMFVVETGLAGSLTEDQKKAVARTALEVMPYTVNGLDGGGPDLAAWCLEQVGRARVERPKLGPSAEGLKEALAYIAAAPEGPGRLQAVLEVLGRHRALVDLERADPVVRAGQTVAAPAAPAPQT